MPDISGFKKDKDGYWIKKDPDAYLSYTVDWSDWMPSGGSITSSTFTTSTVSGDADPIVIEASTTIGNNAVVEISGGTAGNIYIITNTITTNNSLTDVRRFKIVVEQRYI